MCDLRLTRRSVLAGREPIEADKISLKALPEGHVIHVLAKSGADLAAHFAKLSRNSPSVRYVSPGQWFIVGDAQLTHQETAALLNGFAPDAAGIDQSHGRVRILISGPTVEHVLAKGTGIDLALSAFPVDCSATTLIGHIAALVTRVADHAFELIVLRGFAESLWDDLVRMSAEASRSS